MARNRKRQDVPVFGILTTVALLMLSSAAVRVISTPATALATEVLREQPSGDKSADIISIDPADYPGYSQSDLDRVIDELQARKAALDTREQELDQRYAQLVLLEKQIAINQKRLENADGDLRGTLALAQGASEADLSQLTSVYENMKPRESAALFEQMDPAFAAGFISRMRPESAAAILSGVTPQAAYSISAVLASRHNTVPQD